MYIYLYLEKYFWGRGHARTWVVRKCLWRRWWYLHAKNPRRVRRSLPTRGLALTLGTYNKFYMAEYLVPRKLLLSNTKRLACVTPGLTDESFMFCFGYYIEGLLRWLEQKEMIGIEHHFPSYWLTYQNFPSVWRDQFERHRIYEMPSELYKVDLLNGSIRVQTNMLFCIGEYVSSQTSWCGNHPFWYRLF